MNDKTMKNTFNILNDIYNSKTELKKHFNCLASFYSAITIYNELYKNNHSKTFLIDSVLWFKDKGFKIYLCNDGINYLIVNSNYKHDDINGLRVI